MKAILKSDFLLPSFVVTPISESLFISSFLNFKFQLNQTLESKVMLSQNSVKILLRIIELARFW